MKFPQIGEILPNGHTVDAAYCVGYDRYVLAHKDGAPQPYVVWSVDMDGDTRNGHYFSDQLSASGYFFSCCYDWQRVLKDRNILFDELIERYGIKRRIENDNDA